MKGPAAPVLRLGRIRIGESTPAFGLDRLWLPPYPGLAATLRGKTTDLTGYITSRLAVSPCLILRHFKGKTQDWSQWNGVPGMAMQVERQKDIGTLGRPPPPPQQQALQVKSVSMRSHRRYDIRGTNKPLFNSNTAQPHLRSLLLPVN